MTRLAKRVVSLGAALVLPAAAMAARAPSPGEPVKLADTELDQVTAGDALPVGGLLDTAGQGLSGNLWLGPIEITPPPGTTVPPGTIGNPKMMRPLVPSVASLDAYRLGPPPVR